MRVREPARARGFTANPPSCGGVLAAVLAVAVAALAAACTMTLLPEDKALQHGHYRVLEAYEGVAGIYGHGMTATRGPTEHAGFHGRTNDLGETWNPRRLTVAHRSWKPGTLVRVTHLEKGYSAVARVTDRVETFGKARLCDVSPGLAAALDFGYLNRAEVRVEILAPASSPEEEGEPTVGLQPPPASAGKLAVLCGELDDRALALSLAREIVRLAGRAWVEPHDERFRVMAAPTDDRAKAEAIVEKLEAQGYQAEVVER